MTMMMMIMIMSFSLFFWKHIQYNKRANKEGRKEGRKCDVQKQCVPRDRKAEMALTTALKESNKVI